MIGRRRVLEFVAADLDQKDLVEQAERWWRKARLEGAVDELAICDGVTAMRQPQASNAVVTIFYHLPVQVLA